MLDLAAELREEIATGQCVVVVGTGVSAATTGDPKASWPGLISSGVERGVALNLLSQNEADAMRARLKGSSSDLITIATDLARALGGPTGGEFGRWLREDVGYLSRRAVDTSLVSAIDKLDQPIMTTNYDDVLEKILGRAYITWRDLPQMQLWVHGKSNDVLHLHGHWKYADSIVLTHQQYATLQADASLQALKQATAATRSMVFVGFGEGLADPSFGTLRDWIRSVLPFQETRHFRLCRQGELESLSELHKGEAIWPVSYGNQYEDLAPFLESLAPRPVTLGATPTTAFERIEEQVREGAVLTAHVRNPDAARISDLLVAPVLFPVPNEELVRADGEQAEAQPKRCDLSQELEATHILIAGEEHSGVTSALLWLCGEMYLRESVLTPVYVDFLQLGGGPTPLRKRLVRQLRLLGYSLRDDDSLPRLLLVLDNVNSVSSQRLERVALELRDPSFEKVLLGCRTGGEAQIIQHLSGSKQLSFRTRYTGRLARADVRGLATLIDPARSKELVRQAVKVVEAHGLAGTPFTLAMILSAILRGESLLAASSPTSLLDAYIDLLLGRGSMADDPRFGLDAVNKSHILARLSEVYVERRVGALSEFDVIGVLTEILDTYGWAGQASEILADLRERRVLTVRNREVTFTQSSYLYLFAAKRAQVKGAFLEVLKADPLYFAPILAHYAALQRTDFDLVKDLAPKLLGPYLDVAVPRSKLFERQQHVHEVGEGEEELDARFRREVNLTPFEAEEDDDLVPLGRNPSDPDVPFPLQPVDDAPTVPRALTSLGLVSSLIRDTEIVEDQDARRSVFLDLLCAWGNVVDLIEFDPAYREPAQRAAEEFATQLGLTGGNFDNLVEDLVEILPLMVAFGGITTTLSTWKLSRLIDACLSDPKFSDNVAAVVMANHILFDVHAQGWTRLLAMIDDKFGDVVVVRRVLRRVAYFAYLRRPQEAVDEQCLQTFLANQEIGWVKGQRRAEMRARAVQSLQRARLLASGRSLADDDDQGTLGQIAP